MLLETSKHFWGSNLLRQWSVSHTFLWFYNMCVLLKQNWMKTCFFCGDAQVTKFFQGYETLLWQSSYIAPYFSASKIGRLNVDSLWLKLLLELFAGDMILTLNRKVVLVAWASDWVNFWWCDAQFTPKSNPCFCYAVGKVMSVSVQEFTFGGTFSLDHLVAITECSLWGPGDQPGSIAGLSANTHRPLNGPF